MGLNLKAVDPPEVLIAFADAAQTTTPVSGAVPGARQHFAGLALYDNKVKTPKVDGSAPKTQPVD